jgi:hypothetical protein
MNPIEQAHGATALNLEQALRDLSDALTKHEGSRNREARLRAARQVVVRWCLTTLRIEQAQHSLAAIIQLALDASDPTARRTCAVLLVHALAVRGLIPTAAAGDVCRLMESALRTPLLRCYYPFSGSTEQKMLVLERLHRTIGELMQPLQPTFPNWQGLYAG